MKKPFLFLLLSFILGVPGFSQISFKSRLKDFNNRSTSMALQSGLPIRQSSATSAIPLKTGVCQLLKMRGNWMNSIEKASLTDSISMGDTLLIGAFPGDSVVITGSWFHSGPILILNDGYLGFKNANATIIGDVFVVGSNARLDIDSSYMFFPQVFFYQRTLLLAGNAKLRVRNSTMDYSGLSHNLVATDSAFVNMENITYSGFTTNGFYRQSRIIMDGCNQAGEYVITDTCSLSFSNVNTLLLWHQVPDQASLHIDFPDGTFVSQYQFLPNQPGSSGLMYSVEVNSGEEVWWALMPSGGSDVVVHNSELRAIGLWFEGNDTVAVNGLVNNSTYSSFTAGLDDRNLQLINSSVMTWSLYPMDDSHISVQSCILGEIGTMNRSRCDLTSVFADGSGGYVWAVDTTFLFMGFSSLSSSIRSDRNGILLLGYNAVTNGQVQAQGNSIMMILQSTLAEPPILLDKACIWTATLNPLQNAVAGLPIPVTGTASINKTPTSTLMDFYAYRLFYRKDLDTVWTPIGPLMLTEKESDTLGVWNTQGLAPGAYILKMILYDNTPDTNAVDIVRTVNLLPLFMGDNSIAPGQNSRIYPNPAAESLQIITGENNTEPVQLRIINSNGQIIKEIELYNQQPLNISDLAPGVYSIHFMGRPLKPARFVKI